MNIQWQEFDRAMIEIENKFKNNELSQSFIKILKRNKCWKNNAPYCSWDTFTYKMSNDQILDVFRNK